MTAHSLSAYTATMSGLQDSSQLSSSGSVSLGDSRRGEGAESGSEKGGGEGGAESCLEGEGSAESLWVHRFLYVVM